MLHEIKSNATATKKTAPIIVIVIVIVVMTSIKSITIFEQKIYVHFK